MIHGILDGLVDGTESVAYDSGAVAGGAVSEITSGTLNGEQDGWYTIIFKLVASGSSSPVLRFNNDSGTNYGYRGIKTSSATTVSDFAGTSQTGIPFGEGTSSGNVALAVARAFVKSGVVRMVNAFICSDTTGTTVGNLIELAGVWTNTADAVSTIRVSGSNIGNGSRLIILKMNNVDGINCGDITTQYVKKCWTRIGSVTLGAEGTTANFSGLDGDRDVLYMVRAAVKAGTTNAGQMQVNFNSDTGNNYGVQHLNAQNATVSAARRTGDSKISFEPVNGSLPSGYYALLEFLMFAASGQIRLFVGSEMTQITGTTVTHLYLAAMVWNNSANNLTSMSFVGQNSGYAAGSIWEIYALRPNG